jgi:hypothetical protein
MAAARSPLLAAEAHCTCHSILLEALMFWLHCYAATGATKRYQLSGHHCNLINRSGHTSARVMGRAATEPKGQDLRREVVSPHGFESIFTRKQLVGRPSDDMRAYRDQTVTGCALHWLR